jgi:hypothetical protein
VTIGAAGGHEYPIGTVLDRAVGNFEPFKRLQPDDLAGVPYIMNAVVSAEGEAHAYRYGRYLHDLHLADGLR